MVREGGREKSRVTEKGRGERRGNGVGWWPQREGTSRREATVGDGF